MTHDEHVDGSLTRDEALSIANRYILALKTDLDVQHAYLFGSCAKGIAREDSDIDIAIVSSDFQGNPVDDLLRLMRVRRNVDYRIEPHPFLPAAMDSRDPFFLEVQRNGISLIQ